MGNFVIMASFPIRNGLAKVTRVSTHFASSPAFYIAAGSLLFLHRLHDMVKDYLSLEV
jgi:hypothetical protein